jgi:chemotaxis protein MotB
MSLDQLTAENDEEGLDSFYVSFGDLMVIICVFLVMLLTMSKIDIGSFEKIKSVMTGSTDNTLVELSTKLKKIIETAPGIPGASVELAKDGVRVDLDTGVLFAPGKAAIKREALDSIAPLLAEILTTKYLIDIEGHTDDVPFYRRTDDEVETNWSLSGKRASSVILHLRNYGFSAKRLRAVGYAHTRAVVDIKGKTGAELENARARNRRVSLLIR